MSLSFWDSQFKFSAILPDFADRLAWMSSASDAYAAETRLDRLAYGADPRQWIEVAGGAEPPGKYLPVFIHGGYWRALAAETHRIYLKGLAGIGPRRVNLEYRLMPGVRMADLIADAAAGLRLAASELAGDAKLVIIGHSAGAHLALEGAEAAGIDDKIAALVPISGLYDLEPISYSFLQGELGLTADEIARFAPLRHGRAPVAPTLVTLGAEETHEYQRQAETYAARHRLKILRAGDSCHMKILGGLCRPDTPFVEALNTFIETGGCPHHVEGTHP